MTAPSSKKARPTNNARYPYVALSNANGSLDEDRAKSPKLETVEIKESSVPTAIKTTEKTFRI
jgi:hypothetical protein